MKVVRILTYEGTAQWVKATLSNKTFVQGAYIWGDNSIMESFIDPALTNLLDDGPLDAIRVSRDELIKKGVL